ncbi:MAG: thioredoxin family protein [Vampirovibrionales bacterium]|nr:thioredoxin family protein [Vampirovibrionales bacterium]
MTDSLTSDPVETKRAGGWLLPGFFVVGALIAFTGLMTAEAQEARGSLVAFTANWCAACRDVTPLVSEIGQQNGMNVTIIDVDDPAAPKRAKSFGLTIPGRDLPQVYVVQGGVSRLALDGASVGYGQTDAVRARLLKGIQGSR